MLVHGAVGNLNIDFTVKIGKMPPPDSSVRAEELIMGPGGGAVNYSVAVARFGHKPVLIGVATEAYKSLSMLEKLEREGVDTSFLMFIRNGNPGVAIMIQLPGEQRRMITFRGVNKMLSPELVVDRISSRRDLSLVHLASVPPRIVEAVLEWRDKSNPSLRVTYDPGSETPVYREKIAPVAYRVDILYINESEYKMVFGDKNPREVASGSRGILVVKKGEKGATVFDGAREYSEEPPKVKVIDTTGAGDVFNAYFNSCVLEGMSIEESLRYAVVAGALKASKPGSTSSPLRSEVEEFLRSR